MAEFTFKIEEHLLTLFLTKKVGLRKSTGRALMVPLLSLIFVLGSDHTKWAKELLQMKNFNDGGCL